MKYTDVVVGPMTPDEIGREIVHYLNGCKNPSNLKVSIERLDNGKFFTKIYMLTKDFTGGQKDENL